MNNIQKFSLATMPALLVLCLSGCNLKPEYQRPAMPVSDQWNAKLAAGLEASETKWADFFNDPILRQLITRALENNRDLRIAALNVEKARAQYGISRADLFPSLDASADKTAQHLPGGLYQTQQTGAVTYQQYEANLGVSAWEMDFFGRLRNLKDEALENYLSYEATSKATQLSLVAEVSQAYITLCTDRDLLRIAQSTSESQRESLRITEAKLRAGTVTEQDVLQARTSVKSAEADVAKYDRQSRQAMNELQLLAGGALSAEINREATLEKRWVFPDLNTGLPSDVLTRRPDIISAEHTLKAANADIGAARAAFFPSITLTATGGTTSSSLGHLFEGGTASWNFTPSLNLPIFDGGKNNARLDEAKISKRIEIADYEKAIQQAFREVSDALAGVETYKSEVGSRRDDMENSNKYLQLASLRYERGVDDYTNVLTAQRTFYASQQEYINVFAASLNQKVTLYKVLGGGWK